MKLSVCTFQHQNKQKGALIILTMLILLVVSMLGLATIDTSGLEMKMSSNSRTQQQAFEAAEYTLSWVENDIVTSGYFLPISYTNAAGCESACFSPSCTNGYCFSGSGQQDSDLTACNPLTAATEPYATASLWADGSGKFKILEIPNSDIAAKYIIEFWCYAKPDPYAALSLINSRPMYRITAFAVGEGGKARAMLRTVIKQG